MHGPQVPDPRGPRWVPWMAGHMRWWDTILETVGVRGDASFSTTPEFGPPMYCWTHPYTDEPVVDVFDVNHYVGSQVSELFAKRFGADAAVKLTPL